MLLMYSPKKAMLAELKIGGSVLVSGFFSEFNLRDCFLFFFLSPQFYILASYGLCVCEYALCAPLSSLFLIASKLWYLFPEICQLVSFMLCFSLLCHIQQLDAVRHIYVLYCIQHKKNVSYQRR